MPASRYARRSQRQPLPTRARRFIAPPFRQSFYGMDEQWSATYQNRCQTPVQDRHPLSAIGTIELGDTYRRYSQHSYAAYFAEVLVDMNTAEVRARRMLGVFYAGRILNPKTA